jgi:hypothetical protein
MLRIRLVQCNNITPPDEGIPVIACLPLRYAAMQYPLKGACRMMDLTIDRSVRALPGWRRPYPVALPYHMAARLMNVALTAQVQIAYAYAVAASENAEHTASCIEQAWPDTPMRSLVVGAYRARARERREAAGDVLARARRRCGLAFARLG